jgi:hypothetical protein
MSKAATCNALLDDTLPTVTPVLTRVRGYYGRPILVHGAPRKTIPGAPQKTVPGAPRKRAKMKQVIPTKCHVCRVLDFSITTRGRNS